MTLGGIVRKLRLEKRWTQEKLSVASGVNQTSISRIENSASQDIGSRIIIRLAEGLGVSVLEIFERAGLLMRDSIEEDIANIIAEDPEWRDFFLWLMEEPIEKRRRVLKLARAAAKMDWP